MKKIINSPQSLIEEMCRGIVIAHPELELLAKYRVIKRKNCSPDKVSLISGGGSGHEPAHAGLVGKGMLDAAVCGDVFASPSQIQVYQAIKAAASDKGVLLAIKNYSGDVMNFQNAAHMAREDGIKVECVKVDDDIAVQDSLYTVGRRGVAGTVLVHKIAGAAAERGDSLPEVKAMAEKVVSNVKSIGFALTSCTVPAKGAPTFELAESEMEYGVGIHGEPGIRREALTSARELAQRMVCSLCDELQVGKGQRVAVLINGFGATPLMELYLMNNEVARELASKGIVISRAFVGNFMTSIDMAGASVSILKLDSQLEALLDEPCDTPGFKVDGAVDYVAYDSLFVESDNQSDACYEVETPKEYATVGETLTLENMIYIVDAMSACIIKNEVLFCELDSHAGDGDFGMSVAKGFRQLKKEWKAIIEKSEDIGSFLDACSLVIMEHCGGASGPIWGSAFRCAGKYVGNRTVLTPADFASMLHAAVEGIQSIGERSFGRGAVPGDKTLIDALVPCVDAWTELSGRNMGFADAFKAGAQAAVYGAKKTEQIVARLGRAGTVGERSIGYPDAGAHALGIIFTEIAQSLQYASSK
ncbi:MAG: dihydroxyacetone kinase subunit DhaK [Oscillospiraceae bacterium]|nr:dihydroxyacetone kinase subunit DhaK [Oscillospiraceae bacterium]